jgi:predicted YcjX-like family ATPase
MPTSCEPRLAAGGTDFRVGKTANQFVQTIQLQSLTNVGKEEDLPLGQSDSSAQSGTLASVRDAHQPDTVVPRGNGIGAVGRTVGHDNDID